MQYFLTLKCRKKIYYIYKKQGSIYWIILPGGISADVNRGKKYENVKRKRGKCKRKRKKMERKWENSK
jgi:hypothetical protein